MPRSLRWRLLPLVLLAVIVAIPLGQHAWQLHRTHQALQVAQAHTRPVTASPQRIAGLPKRIVVPAAAIDIAVVPGSPDPKTGIWSVAQHTANYAATTAPLTNGQGQTLIYGHNSHEVFGPLLGLQAGAQAVVYTDNGHTFVYTYTGSANLSPNQTELFTRMKQQKGLVLMTCDGNQFQYRHVMQFKLTKVS